MLTTEQYAVMNALSPCLFDLIERSTDIFWVRSVDYARQLYISPAYETVWQRSCQSLYSNPSYWVETVHPDDRHAVAASVGARVFNVAAVSPVICTFRIIRPDQSIRWIEDQNFPIFDSEGHHIGFAGISRDTTEIKEREVRLVEAIRRAEDSQVAKTAFIQNMRHDLRTPLSGIIGLAEMLVNQLKQGQNIQAEHLQMVAQSGYQLMQCLDDVLDFLKQEVVGFQSVEETFVLADMVASLEALFIPAVQEKGLCFEMILDERLPAQVVGRRDSVHRIMLNLLGNAIKFTHTGTVSASFSLAEGSTDKRLLLKLVVRDTGIGIPADKHQVVFDKLTRLIPAHQGEYKGTGLGLHAVKQLVTALEGDLHLESREGVGSTFTVTLPLKSSSGSNL